MVSSSHVYHRFTAYSLAMLPSVSLSKPGGSLCSNYKAELLALYNATEALKLWERKTPKAVFLSDSLSAMQSLTSETPDDSQKRQHQWVGPVNEGCSAVDPCSYRHSGQWNRRSVGKGRQKKYQPSSHLSYKETRTLIRNRQKSTFIASIGGYNPQKDPLHATSKQQSFV